jgi:hypothetical protein
MLAYPVPEVRTMMGSAMRSEIGAIWGQDMAAEAATPRQTGGR